MIVYLTRRASFSAAHCYWLPVVSAEENRSRFGIWSGKEPHGHNYQVSVTVAGEVDSRTGMVVNITDINVAMKRHVTDILDNKFLNREVEYFQTAPTTTENITRFVWESLEPRLPPAVVLMRVELKEMDTLWSTRERAEAGAIVTSLTRVYDFSASHRLHSKHLSDEQNRELFGKCDNPNGHGHNYGVEVTVIGNPDERTGMIFSVDEMDRIVEEQIIRPFDHKHLNLDTTEFADVNPTSEMLSVVIWQKLAEKLPTSGLPRLFSVVVNETARNSFEFRGY
jgi:6-pyruvoyltetrahydropterin/6-carboxytetrahydropterin synthase